MADDGKMLVLQRKQEDEDFPSVLPEFLKRALSTASLRFECVRVAGAPLLRCWKTATWALGADCDVPITEVERSQVALGRMSACKSAVRCACLRPGVGPDPRRVDRAPPAVQVCLCA
jgi:hypothetical protein